MRIVVAPDSFKESLWADQVARAIVQGLRRRLPAAHITSIPIADGGEGSVAALVRAVNGTMQRCLARDPLGKSIYVRYGVKEKTAFIESAASCGLSLIPLEQRNPLVTSSWGTGMEIRHALEKGYQKIIFCLGGVGTNDGGSGMAQALGYKLLDRQGKTIKQGAQGLLDLHHIDSSQVHPALKKVIVLAASDVKNPLCGAQGSAAIYGPQKGATPKMVEQIDCALARFAQIVRRDLARDVLNVPGSGAAGALGAGALAFLNAKIVSGSDLILKLSNADKAVRQADWVITAEGQADGQTAFGKAALGVARLAKKHKKPVLLFCANKGNGAERLHRLGIDAIFSIAPGPISLQYSFTHAEKLLENLAWQVAFLMAQHAQIKSPRLHTKQARAKVKS